MRILPSCVVLSAILLAFVTLPPVTQGQTVRPAVIEAQVGRHNIVDGHFEVANDTLEPMAVTMEAKSFTIDESGTAIFRPLDAAVKLQLSTSSMRLPPRQHRTVYYQVSAPAYPVWFCIYSSFATPGLHHGMQVQLDMPHTVYLLDHTKATADQLHFVSVHREGNVLRGKLQNTSASVVRVLSLELSGAHGKKQEGGFPLLPGLSREFILSAPPGMDHVRAHVAGFSVDGDAR